MCDFAFALSFQLEFTLWDSENNIYSNNEGDKIVLTKFIFNILYHLCFFYNWVFME